MRQKKAALSAAAFRADVTPPLGESVYAPSRFPAVEKIEHPLEARGTVFDGEGGKIVIAAVDVCGICNESCDLLRSRIAEAVGTPMDRVIVHSVHQHTAPILDMTAARIFYAKDDPRLLLHVKYTEDIAQRIAGAARGALENLRTVTRITATRTEVKRVASNRRVPKPDGTIGVRYSAMTDPFYHEAPEGLIDPWLRSVIFYDGGNALFQMHYYATHPQSFYADRNRVTWDVPGIAREWLERESGIFQIYFTGCSGNVTMGKYNTGTPEDRTVLADRLYQAMHASLSAANIHEVTVDSAVSLDYLSRPLTLGLRLDGEFNPKLLEETMANPGATFAQRNKAASFLAWRQRQEAGKRLAASRLRIGSLQMVHLPAEPFVEFQLYAQQLAPGDFVCVAGYDDCAIWYYGPDAMFRDTGDYEQNWAVAGKCQSEIEAALAELLNPPKNP